MRLLQGTQGLLFIIEQAGQAVEHLRFPGTQLIRMDAAFGRNLGERFLLLQNLQHGLGLEFRCVTFSHGAYFTTLFCPSPVSKFLGPLYFVYLDTPCTF